MSISIQNYLQEILTAVYGRDVRQAIHDALAYTVGEVDTFIQEAEEMMDLGLTVQDGLLCAVYVDPEAAGAAE